VQSLSRQLQQVQVLEGEGADADSWHLAVTITAFQGRFDGQAIVAGRWILRRDELIYSQSFQRSIPLSEDGYPALVRALREGWQTEVKQLGQELQPTLTAK
ncbi:MAG: ABC-type transport auxiliary lipoprotein family protein, partial [Aeromonadaceae bacterium]